MVVVFVSLGLFVGGGGEEGSMVGLFVLFSFLY